jgi:hypothetical protein
VLMSAERRSVLAQAHSAVATHPPAFRTTLNMAVTQAGSAWPENVRILRTEQGRITGGPRPAPTNANTSGQMWRRFNRFGLGDASRVARASDADVYSDAPVDALIHIPCWTDDDPFTRLPPRVSRDRKSGASTSPFEGDAQDSPNPFIDKTDRRDWQVRNWRVEDEKANYDFCACPFLLCSLLPMRILRDPFHYRLSAARHSCPDTVLTCLTTCTITCIIIRIVAGHTATHVKLEGKEKEGETR